MATNNRNLSRRQTLVGIGLAGATTMVPGASIAKAAQPDRSAWIAAVAKLKAADAQYESMSAVIEKMYDAAEAACPRQSEFFTRYNLGHGKSYDSNFRAAHRSLVMERVRGRCLTSDEAKQTTADAYRIADDFEAYDARRKEAYRGYDEAEARFDEVVDKRWTAFNELLTTPAPDEQALVFKLERLAAEMTTGDADDAERVEAIRNDARRLLGRA